MIDGKVLTEELLRYAEDFLYLNKRDEIYFRNLLLREFCLDSPIKESLDLSYIDSLDVPDVLVEKVEELGISLNKCTCLRGASFNERNRHTGPRDKRGRASQKSREIRPQYSRIQGVQSRRARQNRPHEKRRRRPGDLHPEKGRAVCRGLFSEGDPVF